MRGGAVGMIARHRLTSDPILDQAIDWMLRLENGAVDDQEYIGFIAWRDADPRHAEVFSKLTKAAQFFDVPQKLGVDVNAVFDKLEQATNRRKLLRNIGAFAGVTLIAGGLTRHELEALNLNADYRTATGERRTFRLADNSSITLNARSAIDVVFDANTRLVRLRAGMLMANVAHDPSRPFLVTTSFGTVQAMGTQFQVHLGPDFADVTVISSKVEVRTRSGSGCVVSAGQHTRFTRSASDLPSASAANSTTWMDGYYIASNARLIDVIDALRPYRRGIIRVDPSVATLRVSGALPLDNTDQALGALEATLPVRVEHLTSYWTTISAH